MLALLVEIIMVIRGRVIPRIGEKRAILKVSNVS